MIIRHEVRNGQIVPVSAEIENEKEVEFLLEQLRPKGEWKQETDMDEMLNIWHCSKCKEEFCSEIGGKPLEWNYNFCPNCGADMRTKGEAE